MPPPTLYTRGLEEMINASLSQRGRQSLFEKAGESANTVFRCSDFRGAGIHLVTLYNWRKAWPLHGVVLPEPEKDPEGWGATDKITVVL